MLQTIKMDAKDIRIFYETGCGVMISKYSALQHLGRKAQQQCKGPIQLFGLWGILTKSSCGIYQ